MTSTGSATGTTPCHRSKAGSLVMQRPSPSLERRTDGGNMQLMEARLTELYSSLRALDRSNAELQQALEDNPHDADFLQALEENSSAMTSQRDLAIEIVRDMRAQGANIDLADDIAEMEIPVRRQEEKEEATDTTQETGVYL